MKVYFSPFLATEIRVPNYYFIKNFAIAILSAPENQMALSSEIDGCPCPSVHCVKANTLFAYDKNIKKKIEL